LEHLLEQRSQEGHSGQQVALLDQSRAEVMLGLRAWGLTGCGGEAELQLQGYMDCWVKVTANHSIWRTSFW
ncbi:ATP6V0D1 isoform 13, partial [Pan troglodytes]